VAEDERGPLRIVVSGTDEHGRFSGTKEDVPPGASDVRIVLERK
jgi:hypothetical protein